MMEQDIIKGNWYRLKTDPPKIAVKLLNIYNNYWGIIPAESPEEAEYKFRKKLAKVMSVSMAPNNRKEAAKRMRERDFEVIECDNFYER